MKKFFAFLLSAILCLAVLAGCGDNGGKNQEGGDGQEGEPAGLTTVNVSDYLSQDVWEDDGGAVSVSAEGAVFDTCFAGDFAALRLKETADNATWKFNLQLTEIPEGLSEAEGNWWDAELCIVTRSATAGSGYDDGNQTGYTVTCWGDMNTVYLGRSGYDDAFGSFAWPCGDGQPHDVEITTENNADKTAVHVKLVVDGEVIAEVDDDGSLVKEDRTALYPDAGGLTVRCKYTAAVIK